MKKIALIDGYGFVFRAYHSLPPLTRADGTPVGAVYGFTNMLIKLIASLEVSHLAVVFDSGSKTFRNEIFPSYKANRPPCPEDLKPQFPIIRKTAESLNLAILEKVGFEADDIIATIAKKASESGHQVIIVSSDKDLMQLVDENVVMYDAMKNKMIGINEVKEKFFVEPNQVLEVLSLIGDASDNVPGVRGIGPKTAAELISEFGNIENLLANIDSIKQEKRRQMLIEGKQNALLSKKLIALREDVELGITFQDLKVRDIEPKKLIEFLEEQGFRSLLMKVKKEFAIEIDSKNESKIFEQKNHSEKIIFAKKPEDQQNTKTDSNLENQSAETKKLNLNYISDFANNIKKTPIKSNSDISKIYQEAQNNGVILIDYFLKNDEIDFITFSTCKNLESPKEIFYYQFSSKNHYQSSLTKEVKINNHLNAEIDLFNFNEKETYNQEIQGLSLDNFLEVIFDNSVRKIFFDGKNFLRFLKNFYRQKNQTLETFDFSKSIILPFIPSGYGSAARAAPRLAGIPVPYVEGTYGIIFDDVKLQNYLLNSSIHNNLRELIDTNLDANSEELGFGEILQNLEEKKDDLSLQDIDKKIDFFCFKNSAIFQLHRIFSTKIFELNLNNAYLSYELPLIEVLAQIEFNGIKIDVEKLKILSKEFTQRIATLTQEIYSIAGEEFNIASSSQLSEILFTKLGLNSSKKSKKTGALSTNFKVLEELASDGFEIAQKIIEFRKFSKLKNTYTDALPKEINPQTNRVHSYFSNTSTLTGRLSSTNPNLQNIPIKSAEGKKIRECFIAEKNCFLISADYSQIELRVLAHVAKIENLIEAFKQNKDIHRITASEVFGIPENSIDDQMRNKAKAINFGIIYGISGFGLAKQLKISRTEASDYIKSYLKTYPGIEEYMQHYIKFARENGYVNTISGRKCFIRGINDRNPVIRADAERQSINAPIQGSAADIIKKAMIRLHKEILQKKLQSKILLQIHDELVVESTEEEVEITTKILRTEMEKSFNLEAPLKVDIEIARSWR